MSRRPHNILICFGSVAKTFLMPAAMKKSVVGLARRFPSVTFIWKYEKEDDVGKGVHNLVKSKWMPQNDLLCEFQICRFHVKNHQEQ